MKADKTKKFTIEKIQNIEELSPCAAILVNAYNGEP